MNLLLRIVFILAFCAATIGAAGFADSPERLAWPLLIGGLAITLATGWRLRGRARARAASAASGDLSLIALGAAVSRIHAATQSVELRAAALDAPALAEQLDEVIVACRLLGNRNEDFLNALGTEKYVRVWDGFAVGERLLARAWSMAADGYATEARAELPKARAHLERAVAGAHD